MSFFDTYKDAGTGNYVSRDEKQILMDNGIPFQIADVIYEEESKFGERFVCRVLLPDTETGEYEDERRMSFSASTVESRDRMLRAMMEYLEEADAEPVWVKIEQVGRSVLIRAAEAPEVKKTRSRGK